MSDVWTQYQKDNENKPNVNEPFIKAFVEAYQPETVLDIGCGDGKLLSLFDTAWLKVGIDTNKESIKIAKQKYDDCYFWQISWDEIKDSARYDTVITNGFLCHLKPDELYQCLKIMFRTARKYILVHEPFEIEDREIDYHRGVYMCAYNLRDRFNAMGGIILEDYETSPGYRGFLVQTCGGNEL